jgi:hypothetical protein
MLEAKPKYMWEILNVHPQTNAGIREPQGAELEAYWVNLSAKPISEVFPPKTQSPTKAEEPTSQT